MTETSDVDVFASDLSHATLKVYERYAVEVVERFGFCPWARSSRESGQVVLRVVFGTDPDDFEESLAWLGDLHRQSPGTDIALFIYPLLDLDRLGFENYTRRLRARAEHATPKLDAYAMAAFHPLAEVDLSHPDRLVPYVRKTPDPTLQLVRNSALSSVKGLSQGTSFVDVAALSAAALRELREPPVKSVRERIAEQNLATVAELGPAAVDATLTDIANERERAHADLLLRHGRRGPRRA